MKEMEKIQTIIKVKCVFIKSELMLQPINHTPGFVLNHFS